MSLWAIQLLIFRLLPVLNGSRFSSIWGSSTVQQKPKIDDSQLTESDYQHMASMLLEITESGSTSEEELPPVAAPVKRAPAQAPPVTVSKTPSKYNLGPSSSSESYDGDLVDDFVLLDKEETHAPSSLPPAGRGRGVITSPNSLVRAPTVVSLRKSQLNTSTNNTPKQQKWEGGSSLSSSGCSGSQVGVFGSLSPSGSWIRQAAGHKQAATSAIGTPQGPAFLARSGNGATQSSSVGVYGSLGGSAGLVNGLHTIIDDYKPASPTASDNSSPRSACVISANNGSPQFSGSRSNSGIISSASRNSKSRLTDSGLSSSGYIVLYHIPYSSQFS